MVNALNKINPDRKRLITEKAQEFISNNTILMISSLSTTTAFPCPFARKEDNGYVDDPDGLVLVAHHGSQGEAGEEQRRGRGQDI